MQPCADVVTQYAEFAGHAQEFACFTEWALGVADDAEVAAWVGAARLVSFDNLMHGLVADGACHWVSNEAPSVLPTVTATLPVPPEEPTFVLGVDGHAVALAHGHGRALDWLPRG